MSYFQYVVLVCLVLCVRGKEEKLLCTKRTRFSNGLEVRYREVRGCCAGYTEVTGEQLCIKCPIWTYGLSCRQRCRCVRKNTKNCDHVTGSCVCRRHWTGQTCAIPSYLFRVKRQIPTMTPPAPPTTTPSICNSCDEEGTADCSPNTGCNCRDGYTGTFCSERVRTTTPTTTPFVDTVCDFCIQANTQSCTINGGCVCRGGWTGTFCQTQAEITTTGPPTTTTTTTTASTFCAQCVAENTQSCASNFCACKPGFGGQFCAEACSEWTYGSGCDACHCTPNNAISCNVTNGFCTCQPYFWGTSCSSTCPDCSSNRLTALSCNDVTGNCVCADGYIGSTCIITCSSFFYGTNCSSRCTCIVDNSRSCDHVTGECYCWPGYTGSNCEQLCTQFTFGQNCQQNCSCDKNNTLSCDAVSGTCSCDQGWTGTSCNESCSNWTYGNNCEKSCICNQTNTQLCDHVTGQCSCNPGYQGQTCNEVCPEYFYGVQCQGVCECDRNLSTSCDPVTGECNCITGYDRPNCNTTCPDMFYGDMCASSCACPSNAYAVCHHITGACTCTPGYVGDVCETECPDNSYGVNCLGACDCQAIHTSYCDKAIGVCVCSSGWEGTRCDTASVTDAFVISTAIVGVIAGSATFLLVLLILFILWKICRCSCTEVKHRAHRNKGAVVLMNSPITPGSNNAAISAMAAATTQLKHDGIYYYSADLKNATDAADDIQENSQNSKEMDTYYYSGIQGAPSTASFGRAPPKSTGNDTYYDDGEVGGLVDTGVGKTEKAKAPSTPSSYQNVSSLAAKNKNIPGGKKIIHPALPVPPVPPVPLPSRVVLPQSGADRNTSKPTERIYRNETAETSFGSKPTYGNTGQRLPGLAPGDNYETLDSNTRDTSGEYAELK